MTLRPEIGLFAAITKKVTNSLLLHGLKRNIMDTLHVDNHLFKVGIFKNSSPVIKSVLEMKIFIHKTIKQHASIR